MILGYKLELVIIISVLNCKSHANPGVSENQILPRAALTVSKCSMGCTLKENDSAGCSS